MFSKHDFLSPWMKNDEEIHESFINEQNNRSSDEIIVDDAYAKRLFYKHVQILKVLFNASLPYVRNTNFKNDIKTHKFDTGELLMLSDQHDNISSHPFEMFFYINDKTDILKHSISGKYMKPVIIRTYSGTPLSVSMELAYMFYGEIKVRNIESGKQVILNDNKMILRMGAVMKAFDHPYYKNRSIIFLYKSAHPPQEPSVSGCDIVKEFSSMEEMNNTFNILYYNNINLTISLSPSFMGINTSPIDNNEDYSSNNINNAESNIASVSDGIDTVVSGNAFENYKNVEGSVLPLWIHRRESKNLYEATVVNFYTMDDVFCRYFVGLDKDSLMYNYCITRREYISSIKNNTSNNNGVLSNEKDAAMQSLEYSMLRHLSRLDISILNFYAIYNFSQSYFCSPKYDSIEDSLSLAKENNSLFKGVTYSELGSIVPFSLYSLIDDKSTSIIDNKTSSFDNLSFVDQKWIKNTVNIINEMSKIPLSWASKSGVNSSPQWLLKYILNNPGISPYEITQLCYEISSFFKLYCITVLKTFIDSRYLNLTRGKKNVNNRDGINLSLNAVGFHQMMFGNLIFNENVMFIDPYMFDSPENNISDVKMDIKRYNIFNDFIPIAKFVKMDTESDVKIHFDMILFNDTGILTRYNKNISLIENITMGRSFTTVSMYHLVKRNDPLLNSNGILYTPNNLQPGDDIFIPLMINEYDSLSNSYVYNVNHSSRMFENSEIINGDDTIMIYSTIDNGYGDTDDNNRSSINVGSKSVSQNNVRLNNQMYRMGNIKFTQFKTFKSNVFRLLYSTSLSPMYSNTKQKQEVYDFNHDLKYISSYYVRYTFLITDNQLHDSVMNSTIYRYYIEIYLPYIQRVFIERRNLKSTQTQVSLSSSKIDNNNGISNTVSTGSTTVRGILSNISNLVRGIFISPTDTKQQLQNTNENYTAPKAYPYMAFENVVISFMTNSNKSWSKTDKDMIPVLFAGKNYSIFKFVESIMRRNDKTMGQEYVLTILGKYSEGNPPYEKKQNRSSNNNRTSESKSSTITRQDSQTIARQEIIEENKNEQDATDGRNKKSPSSSTINNNNNIDGTSKDVENEIPMFIPIHERNAQRISNAMKQLVGTFEKSSKDGVASLQLAENTFYQLVTFSSFNSGKVTFKLSSQLMVERDFARKILPFYAEQYFWRCLTFGIVIFVKQIINSLYNSAFLLDTSNEQAVSSKSPNNTLAGMLKSKRIDHILKTVNAETLAYNLRENVEIKSKLLIHEYLKMQMQSSVISSVKQVLLPFTEILSNRYNIDLNVIISIVPFLPVINISQRDVPGKSYEECMEYGQKSTKNFVGDLLRSTAFSSPSSSSSQTKSSSQSTRIVPFLHSMFFSAIETCGVYCKEFNLS